jgi:hypothetical protein
MHVFIKPSEDDQYIETRLGERKNKVNIIMLLILLALYPVGIQMDFNTISKM